MRVMTTAVYVFDELSDKAKEKAREWYREGINFDAEYSEFPIEDAKTIGAMLGIEIDRVLYEGFGSQGNGACFEGTYRYNPDAVKQLRENIGGEDLPIMERIAGNLETAAKMGEEGFSVSVTHSGRYCHENSVEFEWDNFFTPLEVDGNNVKVEKNQAEAYYAIRDELRSFMRWIYRALEKEYQWVNSDESVDENIVANEYEFTEDGKRCAGINAREGKGIIL